MMSQLARTATWQDGDDCKHRIESVARGEGFAVCRCPYGIDERMPDPVRLHAGLAIEILLERENAQATDKTALYQPDAPRPPGRKLRTNEIDVPYMLAAENTREAQVKCRKVRQNCKPRSAPLDFRNQTFPGST